VDHELSELLAEAYVLGALDRADQAGFEEVSPVRPAPRVREALLDLAEAPALPIDVSAIRWEELAPGVRCHVHREDVSRGVRGCLIWAGPGSRHPRHRHQGAENILVLQGALRDERGTYSPGEICRSAAGSEHSEEVVPGEDCLCYVVYYGGLEMLE
jgi:predicted ChrR family anti-sigma factor